MSVATLQDPFSSLFAPEPVANPLDTCQSPWKVLLVDDEADIHALIRLTLEGMVVEERPLQLFSAFSAQAAKGMLAEHPDLALVLLDVVMETSQAGLDLADYIRRELQNQLIQIVLITGQPGHAPPRSVVANYAIDDYRSKSELTADKLFVSVYAAIRTHHVMLTMARQRQLLDAAEHQAMQNLIVKAAAVDASQDAIIVMDRERRISAWNHAAEKLFGYSAAEAMDQELYALIAPREAGPPIALEPQDSPVAGAGPIIGKVIELAAQRKGGQSFPAEAAFSSFMLDGERHYIGIFRDVTERKRSERELRLAAAAFEVQEGIVVTDIHGTILRVNQAFTEITGYRPDELVGHNPRLLQSGRQNRGFYEAMWRSIRQSGKWEGELWNRRKNGEIFAAHLFVTTVNNGDGVANYFVGTLTDVTLAKANEAAIHQLAFLDPLTALPNRRLLLDRLRSVMASCMRNRRTGALLFLDLDNFKTLNDTLGHETGDLLLRQVAERLTACVREIDTVARLGGDEFVVLLENLNPQPHRAAAHVEAVGEKILTRIGQPFQLGAYTYKCTCSMGATLFADRRHRVSELLKQADLAMYQAKKAGGNTLRFFDPAMQASLSARATAEHELGKAIENGDLQLYCQIQVDSLGRPRGAEALLRWMHPERGVITPDAFIPLAEETGPILAIGTRVLEQACAIIKSWEQNARTRHLTLSINISAEQFKQEDFVTQVGSVLERNPINPGRLKLELRERLLDNCDEAIAKMIALRALGVRFSLDDFGTGYSSLQYLKRMPLDELKIARSFIQGLLTSEDDQAIVRAIIGLAESMGLDIVAGGVETEAQRDFLRHRGCQHYQGFMFGKPLPIDDFEHYLSRTH